MLHEVGDVVGNIVTGLDRRRRAAGSADVIVVNGRVGLKDRIGHEVVARNDHGVGGFAKIDNQRCVQVLLLPPSCAHCPRSCPVSGNGLGSGSGV